MPMATPKFKVKAVASCMYVTYVYTTDESIHAYAFNLWAC